MSVFGPHLMLDGYGCDQSKLQDLDLVYGLLEELPARIGMTRLMPPYVFRYAGARPEDWGLSGFVLIAESHISIHTFPEKSFVSVDIFSCRAFDADLAARALRSALGMARVETRVLDRGTGFPRRLDGAAGRARARRRRLARPAAPRRV
jgi:S-adenosylmethionine decarboxylase